ncbi:MAG: exosome complex protein Rrp42 [Candidatus Micrarchaeota archaeon]|nr:exosome complex protein Rrp42 [Candidatus Micrarchaeota archaeon]
MEAIDIVKASYIKELLERGEREDARDLLAFRKIDIETGLIKNAEGSAQVDLGATRVLAGVKLSLDEPMDDTPNQGNLICSAELLPLASASYETGPPSPEAIEFARVVDRGIRAGNCVDLESLFVEEGKAWSVYVDLYVLNYSGNLFDAGGIAAMSALLDTGIPKYEDGKVIREERPTKLKIDNMVTSTTFAKVGSSIILDPTGNEEKAADSRLTIAVDKENVRAMQKGMSGGLSVSEIEELIDVAFNKHGELSNKIKKSQR